jgi:hypothetical protein
MRGTILLCAVVNRSCDDWCIWELVEIRHHISRHEGQPPDETTILCRSDIRAPTKPLVSRESYARGDVPPGPGAGKFGILARWALHRTSTVSQGPTSGPITRASALEYHLPIGHGSQWI